MSGHTPGPWRVRKVVDIPHSYEPTWQIVGGENWGITNVHPTLHTGGLAEGEANAYLIGASPQMLEALREARGCIQSQRDQLDAGYWHSRAVHGHYDDELAEEVRALDARLATINAAINQATGGGES